MRVLLPVVKLPVVMVNVLDLTVVNVLDPLVLVWVVYLVVVSSGFMLVPAKELVDIAPTKETLRIRKHNTVRSLLYILTTYCPTETLICSYLTMSRSCYRDPLGYVSDFHFVDNRLESVQST